MALQDLHRAERPAEALRLERAEVGRRQPAAEHRVDVAHVVARLHQAQAELGVLADAPLRPAADRLERVPAHQRHRAVLDDRVPLVAVMHADAEEAVELPVRHAPERGALEVAVRLRRLHDRDGGVGEMPGEPREPAAVDRVVGVDDADHLGARVGLAQREVERAGLESGPLRQVEEAEAGTRAARSAPRPAATAARRGCCCRRRSLRSSGSRAAPANPG